MSGGFKIASTAFKGFLSNLILHAAPWSKLFLNPLKGASDKPFNKKFRAQRASSKIFPLRFPSYQALPSLRTSGSHGNFSSVLVHVIGWSIGIITKPFNSLVRAFKNQRQWNHTNHQAAPRRYHFVVGLWQLKAFTRLLKALTSLLRQLSKALARLLRSLFCLGWALEGSYKALYCVFGFVRLWQGS